MIENKDRIIESDSDLDAESSVSLNSRYASPLVSISPNEVLEYDVDYKERLNNTLDEKISKIKTNDERHQEFIDSIPFTKRRSSVTSAIKNKDVSIGNIVEDFKQDVIEYRPNDNPIEKELSEYQHSIFIKHKKYHKENGISAILARPDETKICESSKGYFAITRTLWT